MVLPLIGEVLVRARSVVFAVSVLRIDISSSKDNENYR